MLEARALVSAYHLEPTEEKEAAVPTDTFIDDLFLTQEGESLNRIPICGQFAITGLPSAGKPILIEETL